MPLSEALFKSIRAIIVLLFLLILWPLQFLLFLPAVLIAKLLTRQEPRVEDPPNPVYTKTLEKNMTFSRVFDVSKIFGCNTRNVKYRWQTYSKALSDLKNKNSVKNVSALDFGAGSLRDTYELAALGFSVTALDMSPDITQYQAAYTWPASTTSPQIFCGSVNHLPASASFNLITAFDVLEHLHDLDGTTNALYKRLNPGGYLLATVPNRKSMWERFFYDGYAKAKKLGTLDPSGIPHVQFKSPGEWKTFFLSQGFQIESHDMALGFFVNDCWSGFYGTLTRKYVEPLFRRIIERLAPPFEPCKLENVFYPRWLMEQVHALDILTKPIFFDRWGWNLFVLRKAEVDTPSLPVRRVTDG